MNQHTKGLVLFLVLLPTSAFAHGVEILLTVAILLGAPVLFLMVILILPLFPSERARLIVVYFVSIGVTFFLTSLLTYWVHETLINWLIGLVPAGTTVAAYLRLRAKRNMLE